MRKDELRSLIKNLVPKYEEVERFHPRFIDAAIEKALAEFYNLVFLRSPHELQRYTKEFNYTVANLPVLEASTALYYVNYPLLTDGVSRASIIPIPDKASGVRRISTMTQGGLSFLPMDAREMDLIMSGSYVDYTSAKIGYVPRRTRVEFYGMTAAVIAAGLRMDLLIPFSQYDDSDTVLVPELVSDEGAGFTDRVLQILEGVKPVELNENKSLEDK